MNSLRDNTLTHKAFRILAAFALSLCVAADESWAAPVDEFYIKQALDRYYALPRDARTLALGDTSTSTCRTGECVYLNPAGLGRLTRYELVGAIGQGRTEGEEFLEEESIEQYEDNGYFAAAIPLGEDRERGPQYGNIALGYSRYQGDTDDSINTIPDGHRRTVSYGIAVDPDASIGYSFTFYDDQLHSDVADLHSHSRVLHILGVQYDVTEKTTIGAMFRLGTGQSDTEDYTLKSDGLSRPRELGGVIGLESRVTEEFTSLISLRYQHFRSKGNLAAATEPVVIGSDEEGTAYSGGIGGEYNPVQSASVRFGFYYEAVDYEFSRTDLTSLSGNANGPHWSAGLGYVFKDVFGLAHELRLDYGFAYSPIGDDSWEHLLSFGIVL